MKLLGIIYLILTLTGCGQDSLYEQESLSVISGYVNQSLQQTGKEAIQIELLTEDNSVISSAYVDTEVEKSQFNLEGHFDSKDLRLRINQLDGTNRIIALGKFIGAGNRFTLGEINGELDELVIDAIGKGFPYGEDFERFKERRHKVRDVLQKNPSLREQLKSIRKLDNEKREETLQLLYQNYPELDQILTKKQFVTTKPNSTTV